MLVHKLLSCSTLGLSVLTARYVATPVMAQTTMPTAMPAPLHARGADQIVADLDATPMPKFDPTRKDDATYSHELAQQMTQAMNTRLGLINELYAVEPDSARVKPLLVEAWRILGQFGRGPEADAQIAHYFATEEIGPEREEAAYYAAMLEVMQMARTDDDRLAAAARYRERAHDPARVPDVLLIAADRMTDPTGRMRALRQIGEVAPDTTAAVAATGKIKQLEQVGHPFELAFSDALTGQAVSIAGLKGKVVIIDFWATWCGPCRKSIPEIRALYDDLHGQGLEVISVSLDSAGDENLAKLRKMAGAENMHWYHYYQGEGFESSFSNGWGITMIPQMFLVDRQGKLASVDARKNLASAVRQLLAAKPN